MKHFIAFGAFHQLRFFAPSCDFRSEPLAFPASRARVAQETRDRKSRKIETFNSFRVFGGIRFMLFRMKTRFPPSPDAVRKSSRFLEVA
jgi:hypothetical protein